jgi:hypothetical protein
MDYDLIRRSMNHKSGGSITDNYIVANVDLIRPVFEKIAEGFGQYYVGNLTGGNPYDIGYTPEEQDSEGPLEF